MSGPGVFFMTYFNVHLYMLLFCRCIGF
jgi:hypothetical protein